MNIKTTILLLFCTSLWAEDPSPEYEWIDGTDLSIEGGEAHFETDECILKIKVIEYDEENNSYLIEYTQSEKK